MKPQILEPRFLAAAKYAYEFVTSEKERSGRAESYNRETVEHIASHLQKALSPQPAAPVPVPLGKNVTRDGRKARVLCNDLQGAGKKVIAAIESRSHPDAEVTSFHYENGRINLDGTDSDGDLVGHLPPEPRKPREFWLNCYELEEDTVYESKEHADKSAAPYRTECVHVREVLP